MHLDRIWDAFGMHLGALIRRRIVIWDKCGMRLGYICRRFSGAFQGRLGSRPARRTPSRTPSGQTGLTHLARNKSGLLSDQMGLIWPDESHLARWRHLALESRARWRHLAPVWAECQIRKPLSGTRPRRGSSARVSSHSKNRHLRSMTTAND